MFSQKSSALVLGILALSAMAATPSYAALKPLASNQVLGLDTSWYTSRGTGIATNGTFKLSGPNAFAQNTITGAVLPNGKYELVGKAVAGVASKTTLGVVSYDKDWRPVGNVTVTPTTTQTEYHIPFTVPAKAAYVRAYAQINQKTDTTLSVTNLQLKPEASDAKLRYAPPQLVNPITMEIGNGLTFNRLKDNQDYIIKLPKEKKVGSTAFAGGRNIVLIGGHITVPVGDTMQRALYFKDTKGTVHVEGVLIDGSGGAESDAIAIAAPEATVQIQNVRVDGIFGLYSTWHADVIQPWGGVKKLLVDKLTGYSGYQGLQIDKDRAPIEQTSLSRVNLVSTGQQIWGKKNNGGFLLWLIMTDEHCADAYPVTMNEVYVRPRDGRALGKSIWPSVDNKTCGAVESADGMSATFPKLPMVTGTVKKGVPAKGDFVPAASVGINYVSPGYVQQ